MNPLIKRFFLIAAVATTAFSFAPSAIAQTADSTQEGASVDAVEGPANAAAAVLVEFDADGEVTSLSASSSFGESGAAAAASSDSALSVGSSVGVGTIVQESETADLFEGKYINFGTSSEGQAPFNDDMNDVEP